MTRLKFKIQNKSENLLELKLSSSFRYFFMGISVFVLYFVFLDSASGYSNVIPFAFAGICMIAALYNEAWIFDKTSGIITQRHGLLFAYRSKTVKIEDVELFQVSGFMTGNRKIVAEEKRKIFETLYTKLSLSTRQGKIYDIEISKSAHKAEIKNKAEKLAQFCKVPLTMDII